METFKKAKCNHIPVAFSKAHPETVHQRETLDSWQASRTVV